MSKTLVAYFSCSGVTKRLAKTMSEALKTDLFEIEPTIPYTSADLNWRDKNSRSTIEMKDLSSRPTIAKKLNNIGDYDTIFLGFPIWWYIAPTIINTFLESYDMSNKTIVVFATSGGSKFGKTMEHLKGSCLNANLVESDVLSANMTKEDITAWVKTLNI